MNATDPYNLQRYLDAQEPVYDRVLFELRRGWKMTHWMWFMFPRFKGLGSSPRSVKYAISSLEEARAYLDHPVLGSRLRECTLLVVESDVEAIHRLLGPVDGLKFQSSMTLFARATEGTGHDGAIFTQAMDKYFGGERDQKTLDKL